MTPCSLYSAMVSRDERCLSPLYFSWIAFIFGWSAVIALIWRLCLTVRGMSITRTIKVNATMATPKFRNSHE